MKNMMKILAVGLASISFSAMASVNNGFYIGMDAGMGATSCSTCSTTVNGSSATTGSTSNSGFAGTILAGFQMNYFLAAELGYGVLPSLTYSVNLNAQPATTSAASLTHYYGAVKLMLPLPNEFDLFAKLGYGGLTIASTNNGNTTTSYNNALGPFLAAGVSYSFTNNAAMTFALNQIFSTPQNSSTNINVTYGTVGVIYSFG